jgi:hypothetical protein
VRIAIALLLAVSVGLATAACGGGETPSDRAPPDEWAANICGALGEWKSSLEDGAADLQTDASGATSIDQARQFLVDYLEFAIDITDDMLSRVERAGAPAVEDGEAIANDLREELGKIKPSLESARDRAADLPDDPQAFGEQAQELGASLSSEGDEISERLDDVGEKYDSEEINQAFDSEPACESLQ